MAKSTARPSRIDIFRIQPPLPHRVRAAAAWGRGGVASLQQHLCNQGRFSQQKHAALFLMTGGHSAAIIVLIVLGGIAYLEQQISTDALHYKYTRNTLLVGLSHIVLPLSYSIK
ncbi:hypothetical protein L207DRAFT_276146 [Hyaloscypha variabilis F]|jgi:hypothetical protein|uniref:Uncharacterized protein n=1 Tax=Hyaloscypha variabilis (strain UAMH 11265 / GT02V1 / F) TaxID=1149755 RepID=A0A2J6S0F7_HYAVF|nr:hypothetical protein L207DRAFT_276146 [Hyaloscypha variabilis F]